MLFALCNLTSFEAVSQQYYNFPHYDPVPVPNYVNKDWKPTGLTPTINPDITNSFAHSFNSQLRVIKNPTVLWEKSGGVFLSATADPQSLSSFYLQDFTYRMVARTSFNDIAYIPKDALWRLYLRITADGPIKTYISSFDTLPAIQDSIYSFIFSPPVNPGDPPRPRTYGNVRPGLLIVAGQYTTMPDISCGGLYPVRDNAAIYVIDAGSLQPLRMFKFFQCSGPPDFVRTSNFTAIRYLDGIDRFVAVGSCENFEYNTDILSFSGDLLYLLWDNIPQTDAHTHRYDIKEPYLDDYPERLSCLDVATGVDLRYFKKPVPPNPVGSYYTDQGAIMVSAYLTNTRNEEVSVILRLNHDGSPHPTYPGRTKMTPPNPSNNRAHAVSFLIDDVSIWQDDPAELGVTGYIRANQVDNIYIAKFNQMAIPIADKRYPINNTITEKPGFSIVSTGDGYAVTGRYQALNATREHLSYLRVDNALDRIEHTIFPFLATNPPNDPNPQSYGQRMRFTNGSGLILGGISSSENLGNCYCDGIDTSCFCPSPSINCTQEWRSYTKNPLTLTQTNSSSTSHCRESINSQSIPFSGIWWDMTACNLAKMKPKYDVCHTPLPNGLRAKLYNIKGTNCKGPYCGQK